MTSMLSNGNSRKFVIALHDSAVTDAVFCWKSTASRLQRSSKGSIRTASRGSLKWLRRRYERTQAGILQTCSCWRRRWTSTQSCSASCWKRCSRTWRCSRWGGCDSSDGCDTYCLLVVLRFCIIHEPRGATWLVHIFERRDLDRLDSAVSLPE